MGLVKKNVENRAVFWLLSIRAGTASKLSAPAQQLPWGRQKIGQGSKVRKGLLNQYSIMLSNENWGTGRKVERGGFLVDHCWETGVASVCL